MSYENRIWQEPLEQQLASILIYKIPEDAVAIKMIVNKLDSGYKVIAYLPETNLEIDVNKDNINHAIIKIYKVFMNNNQKWKKMDMLVFYNGDNWEYEVKYKY